MDEALEPVPDGGVVPEAAGLPEVPLSPVLDDPLVPLVPDVPLPDAPALPEAEPEADEGELDDAVLPGLDVSVLLLEALDGGDDGEVDDDVLPEAPDAPECDLSQPVTAAPAKARTATTGMSFFMTSPMDD